MPKQYEAIRDSLLTKGYTKKAAERRAARIYNAKHPKRPVTGKRDD